MNDKKANDSEPDMLAEYDFSNSIRGKHAEAYGNEVLVTIHKADGTTEQRSYSMPEGAVVVDSDLRPYFPNAKAVNRALRVLVELIPDPTAVDKAMS